MKTIVENNKIVAEFMGLKVISKDEYLKHPQHETLNVKEYSITEYQRYHLDWSWLMEVVEKIESLNNQEFNVKIQETSCIINGFEVYDDLFINIWGGDKKDAVYTAICKFIEWYNEQKK